MKKFTKKTTAIMLAVMMLVAVVPSVAFADEPAKSPEMIIRTDSDYHTNGEEFTAEVWVYNADFNVAGFAVSYDSEGSKLSDEDDFYNTVDFNEYHSGKGIFECVPNSVVIKKGTVATAFYVSQMATQSPVVPSATNENAKEIRTGSEGLLIATIKFKATKDAPTKIGFTKIPSHADFDKKAYVLGYKGNTLDDVKLSVEYGKTPYADAESFKEAVDAIGEVTLEKETAINAAYSAYEDLSETSKALSADKKAELDKKKAEYDDLVSQMGDSEVAKKVIDHLKELETMQPDNTGEMQSAIDVISKEYEELTENQKAIVNEAVDAGKIISDAKERLASYLEEIKYEKAVTAMQEVQADSEITLEDKQKVYTAKTLYDELSDGQKAKIDEKLLEALNAALETIKELEEGDKPDYLIGDVNNDGKINALDATQILRHANNKPSSIDSLSEEEAMGRCDTNGDNKINALDATQILRYANNKPSALKK